MKDKTNQGNPIDYPRSPLPSSMSKLPSKVYHIRNARRQGEKSSEAAGLCSGTEDAHIPHS